MDVHPKSRLKADEDESRIHLSMSLSGAETRKEGTSASGGKVEAFSARERPAAAPTWSLQETQVIYSSNVLYSEYEKYSYHFTFFTL